MTRPRALDLFCGAGGAGMGLHLAGFDVVGVDIAPQPRYPFEFHQADAMTFPLDGFDFVWASPPCQRHSITWHLHKHRSNHADLIDPTRRRLVASGVPYVIENVRGAPLGLAAMLCGTMFGLKVFRHRWFETSHLILVPEHRKHDGSCNANRGGYKGGRNGYVCVAGHNHDPVISRKAMGIAWMTRDELSQAIPPAYSRWIGEQMMPRVLSDVLNRRGRRVDAAARQQRPPVLQLDLGVVAPVVDVGLVNAVAPADTGGARVHRIAEGLGHDSELPPVGCLAAHVDKYRAPTPPSPLQAETPFIPHFDAVTGLTLTPTGRGRAEA